MKLNHSNHPMRCLYCQRHRLAERQFWHICWLMCCQLLLTITRLAILTSNRQHCNPMYLLPKIVPSIQRFCFMTYLPRDIICMPIVEMPKHWRQPLSPSTRLTLDILRTLPTLHISTFLYYPTSIITQHHAGQEVTTSQLRNKATCAATNNITLLRCASNAASWHVHTPDNLPLPISYYSGHPSFNLHLINCWWLVLVPMLNYCCILFLTVPMLNYCCILFLTVPLLNYCCIFAHQRSRRNTAAPTPPHPAYNPLFNHYLP